MLTHLERAFLDTVIVRLRARHGEGAALYEKLRTALEMSLRSPVSFSSYPLECACVRVCVRRRVPRELDMDPWRAPVAFIYAPPSSSPELSGICGFFRATRARIYIFRLFCRLTDVRRRGASSAARWLAFFRLAGDPLRCGWLSPSEIQARPEMMRGNSWCTLPEISWGNFVLDFLII